MFKQDEMKKFFRTLCVLGGVSLALASCLGDDDESSETYSDIAITQVTLGTLNRYTQTTSTKTGNDTIIKSTVTGTSYPMTIDQLGGRIYNQKLLPVGTDVKHVILTTVSTKRSGVVAIQSMTSDSLSWLSTKDSIDFSQPRIFKVYSSDGTSSRNYTVTLNVSETEGVDFGWTKKTEGIATDQFADKQLIAFGDTVLLVERGIVVKDGLAYRMNGQQVERSADLSAWETVGTANLKQIIAAGTKELFALGDDGLMKHSEDDGQTWQDEELDTDASLLPAENIAAVTWSYASMDNADYVLMAGNHPTDNASMVVWRKISQYDGMTKGGQWVYMPVDDENVYALPRQEQLSMACYDDFVLAVGSNMKLYQSVDQGITWKQNEDYTLPEKLTGSQVCMTVDKNGHLWLLTNSGQLWRSE